MSEILLQSPHKLTGGVLLDDHKIISTESAIENCPLPEYLTLPLNMHAGVDAIAVVSVGDRLSKYQIIAEAEGPVSAFIHSPVEGEVVAIKSTPVANLSGLEELSIIVKCDLPESTNENPIENDQATSQWSEQTPEQLLQQLQTAGLVGLGGAGFPTHLKLSSSLNQCQTLLVNGVECEPYISCDDRSMREFADELLVGVLITCHILALEKVQIAIEDNKQQAIASMLKAIERLEEQTIVFEIIEIPSIYPSGGEKQLIELVTGQQVPSGKFPSSLGYIVQNVGTLLAIHDAVTLNKPLIDRIVTITGDGVTRPGNYRTVIGTPIRHLLNFAGWDESKTSTLIHGGPMMGFPLADADRPIVKISNCIIAASTEEFPKPEAERSCIRCGQCADVCPASLLPQQLFWFSRSGEINKAEDHNLLDCIECGACAYVCPSDIPLVDYYRFAKGELRNSQAIKIKAEQSKQRFDFRNQRLENQKLEKQRIREERKRLQAEKRKNESDIDPNKQAVADAVARIKAKKNV